MQYEKYGMFSFTILSSKYRAGDIKEAFFDSAGKSSMKYHVNDIKVTRMAGRPSSYKNIVDAI